MKMPRLAYVVSHPLRIGGHIKSALAMVKYLSERGYGLLVLAPGGEISVRNAFAAAGAECEFVPTLAYRRRLPSLTACRKVAGFVRQYGADVIHAQDYDAVKPAYLAAALLRKRFVFTQPGGAFDLQRPPAKTDTVVFSRELEAAFASAYNLKPELLHFIPGRIDTSIFKPTPLESGFASQRGLPAEGVKVVAAMRLVRQKQSYINSLLQIAKSLPEIRVPLSLAIAGEGPLLAGLREMAAGMKSDNATTNVDLRFVGPVFDSKGMVQLYGYADIIVGTGRGILEAMACGKPTVILGEQGEGEIISPDNVDEAAYFNFSGRHFRNRRNGAMPLCDAIVKLAGDAIARSELGAFSRDYILRYLDARQGAEALHDLYGTTYQEPSSFWDYVIWFLKRPRICQELTAPFFSSRHAGSRPVPHKTMSN